MYLLKETPTGTLNSISKLKGPHPPAITTPNLCRQSAAPVGRFSPNQFGLFDMGGNVWEWCSDSFKNSIDFRVLRGASWRMRSPGDLLSSIEIGNVGHLRLSTYGFRVVLELGDKISIGDLVQAETSAE